MAIIQISQIQNRRGLYQDLPQLKSAEFGWALDQRRLFIGNGTTSEGAPSLGVTEILTEHSNILNLFNSYYFKGLATGHQAVGTVTRSLQDKFDDFVNIRDYGAKGDGVANDGPALLQAITDIYNSSFLLSNPRMRRAIYLPAGIYNLNGTVLRFCPFLTLRGDGLQNTIIVQNVSAIMAQSADSLFQTGAAIGSNGASLPSAANNIGNITIEDLTLQNATDNDIVLLNSTDGVEFRNVGFVGSQTQIQTQSNATPINGVQIRNQGQVVNNVHFENCKFTNLTYAFNPVIDCYGVTFNECFFDLLYSGIVAGTLNDSGARNAFINNIRVSNSIFNRVANTGFKSHVGTAQITSVSNKYINVGNNYTADSTAIAPVVSLYGQGVSMLDTFVRPHAGSAPANIPVFDFDTVNPGAVVVLPNYGMKLGTYTIGSGQTFTFSSVSGTIASIPFTSGVIEYAISLGTANRSGVLKFTSDSAYTTVSFDDDYVENTGLGTAFTLVGTGTDLTLGYVASGTGAILRYSIKQFN